MRRIAILPGNILIPDASAGWLRTGLPLVLQADLASATHVTTFLAESESQAYRAQGTEALLATLEHRNSEYRISVVITNLASQKADSVFEVTRSDSRGLVGAVNAAAASIDANATRFSTSSDRALQSYTDAVTTSELQARMTRLEQAIQEDPGFGLAYFSAMETLDGRDREAVRSLLQRASSNSSRFTTVDQVRLRAISARIQNASVSEQASAADALLKATPNSLDALMSLASLRFLQGNVAAGSELIRKGLSLSPGNPTVRSNLALGLVQARQFKQAEQVYESLAGDPTVLPRLAICVLLEGDLGRADRIFQRFVRLQSQLGDPAVPLLQANWLAISGRLKEATALLTSSQFSSSELRSLALSQSAIWELMRNDRGQARTDADAALRIGTSSRAVMELARAAHAICSGSESVDSLRAQIDATSLRTDQKTVVLAYGLFLTRHFSESADAWDGILKESGGTDLKSRAMLAASLERSGRPLPSDVVPVQAFVPNLTTDDQFAAVAFSEMRRLLGR